MARVKPLNIGIIGCGNISAAYLELASLFRPIRMVACADLDPAAAEARASQYGIKALSVERLLESDAVDIVVNLTIPAAHYGVSRAAIDSGKHVYSEKPFVLSLKEGRDLARRAQRKGVRIGSAPDTFLGGAHQQARHLLDQGKIGRVTSGTAHVLGPGMEHWHPNPDFFFQPGAGPILDIGPYYITNLIQLIGPVRRVVAISATPQEFRTIASQPRAGEKIRVETPTTIHAILEFHSGAVVTLGASWDVKHHGHANMELYGESGTLYVPDPNFFGGDVRLTLQDKPVKRLPSFQHPLAVANQEHPNGAMANYRTVGLADMAAAIVEDRPHRCSLELALHAVEVMVSILKSGDTGKSVAMTTRCDRPEPLSRAQARKLLAKGK